MWLKAERCSSGPRFLALVSDMSCRPASPEIWIGRREGLPPPHVSDPRTVRLGARTEAKQRKAKQRRASDKLT